MKTVDLGGIWKKLCKNKYVLLVLVLGLVLILLPTSAQKKSETAEAVSGDNMEASGIPLSLEGQRIAGILTEIEGVGQVRAIISANGAVIVCEGAKNASVRLNVTSAVMSYTGLGSDRITVMKMK